MTSLDIKWCLSSCLYCLCICNTFICYLQHHFYTFQYVLCPNIYTTLTPTLSFDPSIIFSVLTKPDNKCRYKNNFQRIISLLYILTLFLPLKNYLSFPFTLSMSLVNGTIKVLGLLWTTQSPSELLYLSFPTTETIENNESLGVVWLTDVVSY